VLNVFSIFECGGGISYVDLLFKIIRCTILRGGGGVDQIVMFAITDLVGYVW
jgi:hypothetical protein